MGNRLAVYAAIVLGALIVGCADAQRAPVRERPDGARWRAATEGWKYGFVVGVSDCYFGDKGGRSPLSDESNTDARARLDAYFQSGPRDTTQVLRVLLGPIVRVEGSDRTSDAPRGHVENGGLHLVELMSEGKDAAPGFVEGYLACVAEFLPKLRGELRLSTHDYIAAFGDWYQYSEDGVADSTRTNVPLAEVMRRAALDSTRWVR